MTPFLLEPAIKDYIWGGTRLRDEYGKESDLERLAESWELSCHPDGESMIASGEYKGMKLSGFVREHPETVGKSFRSGDTFPVLVKLIDARNDLSVQVHPDDEYALRTEGQLGKTEMWYVVDCDEGAELVYGFREKITPDTFRRAVEENTLMDIVERVPVHKGDVFFIEPGTLHAIGKGILIAEIQQSSNVTYRVYDYGRVGADGSPRELHVEKAMDVTKLCPAGYSYGQPEKENQPGRWHTFLAECKYFRADKYDIYRTMRLDRADSFRHLLVTEGECEVTDGTESLSLKKGSGAFVPAGTEGCLIKGRCSVIITTV